MKTVYLSFTVILLVLFVNTGVAQNDKKVIYNNSVEKEFKGETYIIDTIPQSALRAGSIPTGFTTIINKNKGVFSGLAAGACYNKKETIPLTDVFKKAISKEKIRLLAFDDKNGIIIRFIYSVKTGKVVHLEFRLRGNIELSNDPDSETDITLQDINKLESLFKEYYFDVSEATCEKFDFGNWNYFFNFSRLLAEEEKEE